MRHKTGRVRCLVFWSTVFVWAVLMVAAVTGRVVPKVVLSGSMEPEIQTGSLVFIHQSVPPEKIKDQDIISYQIGENTQVMHRVVEIDKIEREFITKGDANKYADPAMVSFEQYRGKEIVSIPYAGYMAQFLQSGPVVSGIMFLCMTVILLKLISKKRKERVGVFH